QLTDSGARYLSRLPRLQRLDLSGTGITDRGLEVLHDLPELRSLKACWQRGISDAGVINLAACDKFESVNLMGTSTGDGALEALAGKRNLSRLRTGALVTNAGMHLLRQFPVFGSWQGGKAEYSLMSPDAGPNHLVADGPFTDEGLAAVADL